MMTAVMIALSIGVDGVVVIDIHGVSGRVVKWGLPLSVPDISAWITPQLSIQISMFRL